MRRSLACALLLLAAAASSAQEWRGTGRVSGVVLDASGEPVRGASVVLRWARDPEQGPAAVETGKKGRWALLGLTPGRWLLTIRAEGFRESQGSVDVRAGATPPVEVRLQPLLVQTPTASEGRAESVRTWIEAGNSLLAEERWAEARAEYQKVLAEISGPARAEVLGSVARTYYMEGDVESAVDTLEAAVLAAPRSETTRDLYRSLMEIEGRLAAAEAFLAGVDDGSIQPEPPVERVSEAPVPSPPSREAMQVVAQPGREGAYRTAFDEHHPLAAIEVFAERFGRRLEQIERTDPAVGRYDLARESFEVFVPDAYEPNGEWGLFVWVSPTPSGRVPSSGARTALADNRLIWVGADASGNERLTWNRISLALDAAHNAPRYYEIDPDRIYVGGYSGGGRIATALTLFYPEVFRGGVFVYGVDFYRRVGVPDRPGSDWIPWFPVPRRAALDELRREAHLVLLTGDRDFNRLQTEIFARRYRDEGFEHVTYLEIPGAGHYDWPPRKWLSRAFEALEADGSGR